MSDTKTPAEIAEILLAAASELSDFISEANRADSMWRGEEGFHDYQICGDLQDIAAQLAAPVDQGMMITGNILAGLAPHPHASWNDWWADVNQTKKLSGVVIRAMSLQDKEEWERDRAAPQGEGA